MFRCSWFRRHGGSDIRSASPATLRSLQDKRRLLLLLTLVALQALPGAEGLTGGQILVSSAADLSGPMGLTEDTDGQLLVSDTDNNRILKCPNWRLNMNAVPLQSCVVVAGDGQAGWQAEKLRNPYGAVPAKLNSSSSGFYVADTFNHRVQYFESGSSSGVTVVGGPGVGAPGFDEANQELSYPSGLALDDTKSLLYVADTGHHRVVRYQLNSSSGRVLGKGKTVAGTYKVRGPNVTLLDNPSALYIDGIRDILYVADTRNRRVMRWIVRADALQIEAEAEKAKEKPWWETRRLLTVLSELDNGSNASNVTAEDIDTTSTFTTTFYFDANSTSTRTMTTSTFSSVTSTSSTTQTATSTTIFSGPRAFVEFDNLAGRPYGVVLSGAALYISDADACVVWKKLGTERTVMAGNTCGVGASQLFFPANIVVSPDGGIAVCDSNNNRVIRFPSQPSSRSIECALGEVCDVTFFNGNPVDTSALTLVASSAGSSCGGRCLPSDLGGPFSQIYTKPRPPLLRTMEFSFGLLTYGSVMTTYKICFGAESIEEEVAAGNCTSMPYEVGSVYVFPSLQADMGSDLTECVKGGLCSVNLTGYGIPDTIRIAAAPKSEPGSGAACGYGEENFGVDFQDFVATNPGDLVGIYLPYAANAGNQTALVRIDFKVAQQSGSNLLCVCFEGIMCNSPRKFTQSAGYLRVRSATGGQTYYCSRGQNCIINVTGKFLKSTDFIATIPYVGYSCSNFEMKDVISGPFNRSNPQSSGASPSSVYVNNGDNWAVFDLGNASEDGLFSVCYCASYDRPTGTDGSEKDTIRCNDPTEYTQAGGRLAVSRIELEEYECALGKNCNITARGYNMQRTDHILVAANPATTSCGRTVPTPAQVASGEFVPANYFPTSARINGTIDFQYFDLGMFGTPGRRQTCICSSFDEDPTGVLGRAVGACNDQGEFFQPNGVITIRGPNPSNVVKCDGNLPCIARIFGERLSSDDVLQVCTAAVGCGQATACAALGPKAKAGLLEPDFAVASETRWSLGSLPIGQHLLCYCSPGINSSAEIPCSSPADLYMSAGSLQVRGVRGGQYFKCLVNQLCQFTVDGFDLWQTDYVIAIPLSGTCGASDMVTELNLINPNAKTQGFPGSPRGNSMLFEFNSITVASRFRVCYCILQPCQSYQSYTEDAGILIAKGIAAPRYSPTCLLGQNCGLTLSGAGLERDTDRVMMITGQFYPCGGKDFRVVGGGLNGTDQMNGTYAIGSGLLDGRAWFGHRSRQMYIFYDVFAGRWIIGPDRTPDVPNQLGWAFATGEDYTTPEWIPKGSWQIWQPASSGTGGRWVLHPDLQVVGIVDPNTTFTVNPNVRMTAAVADTPVGTPFLTSATFDLGIATTVGTFKICWCPSLDYAVEQRSIGGDLDTQTCSGDQEYSVHAGALLIGYLKFQGRHHCVLGAVSCTAQVPLPTNLRSRAALLPVGTECFKATSSTPAAWEAAKNVTGRYAGGEQVLFNFGAPTQVGEYEICICSDYDDGVDGVVCSAYSEFYEQGGSVTVSSIVALNYEAGRDALLNLTLGSGLADGDRLIFHLGGSCDSRTIASARSTAVETTLMNVSANGAWASVNLGRSNKTTYLASGIWVACLCPQFDGADTGNETCNSPDEFGTQVARVQVSTVKGPDILSTITSSIQLRVQLARRLAAVDGAAASLTFDLSTALETAIRKSLETLLGTSGVTVDITGITPLRATNSSVNVTANFTSTLRGSADSQLLEVREADNRSCPLELLQPPWQGNVQVSSDSDLLMGCLSLAQFTGYDTDASAQLSTLVAAELSTQSIPGLTGPTVVIGLSTPKAPAIGYQPEYFKCVRGGDCKVRIHASGPSSPLPPIGSLLVVEGSGQSCGSASFRPSAASPTSRAVSGFGVDIPVNASASSQTSVRIVDLELPRTVGSYTLCYCSGTDSGKGACGYDRDYYNRVGVLTVRGPAPNLEKYCVVNFGCTVSIEGVELSVWDWLLIKEPGGSCFDSSSVGFNQALNFSINPAGLPVHASDGSRVFNVGLATLVGRYQLCYCAGYSAGFTSTGSGSALPCQSPADFTMDMGTLVVRGVQKSTFRYGCTKSIKGDGYAPCSLYLTGFGLIPDQDRVVVMPQNGTTCGEVAASRAFGFTPNPIVLNLPYGDPVVNFGSVKASVAANWIVERADLPGNYRVCYCADSPDGLMDGRGACWSGASGFYHEVGTLKVRGADAGHVFMCYPGNKCELTIYGTDLTPKDKVRLVGPEDSCNWPYPTLKLVEASFANALDVSPNGTSARYDLGQILDISPLRPVTARVCYCANYNADYEGVSCTNTSDFTHMAGLLHIAVCPSAPALEFSPPVEDVYGKPGDAKVRFYAVPATRCLDSSSTTAADLMGEVVTVPLGAGNDGPFEKGGLQFSQAMYLSTAKATCEPSILLDTAGLNDKNRTQVDAELVGGRLGYSVLSSGVQLGGGFKVHGHTRVFDRNEPPNIRICPEWKVEIISYGCSSSAPILLFSLLHILIVIIMFLSCASAKLLNVLARIKILQPLEAALRSEPREEKIQLPPAPPSPAHKSLAISFDSHIPPDTPMTALGNKMTLKVSSPWDIAHTVQKVMQHSEEDALTLLCSKKMTALLGLSRLALFAFHVPLVVMQDVVGDFMLLCVVPWLVTVANLAIQICVIAAVWGCGKLATSIRTPQFFLHSATLTLKLHLDLVFPLVAVRNHCELWRPAMILVGVEIILQILIPVRDVLFTVLPKRRVVRKMGARIAGRLLALPTPAVPEPLEAIEVDDSDKLKAAAMEDPYFNAILMKPAGGRQSQAYTRGSTAGPRMSVTSGSGASSVGGSSGILGASGMMISNASKVPKGAIVGDDGNISLAGITHGTDRVTIATGPRKKKRVFNEPTRLAGGLMIEEGKSRAGMRVRRSVAAARQNEQVDAMQHVLRMQALRIKVRRKYSKRTWCSAACFAACEACFLICYILRFCIYALCTGCRSLGYACRKCQWATVTAFSSFESTHPEEYRRYRILSLWTFLDQSGWYVASVELREPAEQSGGFHLNRMEGRWALLSFMAGGLDLAAFQFFLVVAYAARLTYTEYFYLIMSIVVSILQAGRTDMGTAALSLADDYLDTRIALAFWLCAAFVFRTVFLLPAWYDCATLDWLSYLWVSATVIAIWAPLLLVCWSFWPTIVAVMRGDQKVSLQGVWTWIKKTAWSWVPRCCRPRQKKLLEVMSMPEHFASRPALESPKPPPSVPVGSPMPNRTGVLVSLGKVAEKVDIYEAARAVQLIRKKEARADQQLQKQYPEAEPLTAAFYDMVDELKFSLPPEVCSLLLDSPRSPIQELRGLLLGLYRHPPPKREMLPRLAKLEQAMKALNRLKQFCQYMDKSTRDHFDDLREITLDDLWRLRLQVSADRMMRSSHFRNGSLASKAQLIAAVLPTAPRIWLVHHRTLDRLGRIPGPLEFSELTLATDAHAAHGSRALMVMVVHHWRIDQDPDPHGVTWRQLMTFASWYRQQWGERLELYFWIDWCCKPETKALMKQPLVKKKKDVWDSDDDDYQAPLPNQPDTTEEGQLKRSKTGLQSMLEKKGLASLAAWAESSQGGLEQTGENLEEEEDPLDKVDFGPVTDQREEPADFAGADAFLPALYAASDAVVVCESHRLMDYSWSLLSLSLAYSFSPMGRCIYSVGRRLVHVTKKQRDAWRLVHGNARKATEQRQLASSVAGELSADLSMEPTDVLDPIEGLGQEASRAADNGGGIGDSSFQTSAISEVTAVNSASFATTDPQSAEKLEDTDDKKVPPLHTTFRKENSPKEFARECMQNFVERVKERNFETELLSPVNWGADLLVDTESDYARINRLTCWAMDAPRHLTIGDSRRPKLVYGKSKALVCSLSDSSRRVESKPAVQTEKHDESSSDSGEDEEEKPEEVPLPKIEEKDELPMLTYKKPVADWDDRMMELYYGAGEEQRHQDNRKDEEMGLSHLFSHLGSPPPLKISTKKHKLMSTLEDGSSLRMTATAGSPNGRRALASDALMEQAFKATLGSSTSSFIQAASSTRSLQPRPALKESSAILGHVNKSRFHLSFVSKMVVFEDDFKMAKQLDQKDTFLQTLATGSGGMAVLARPLEPRTGVCPDSYDSLGITFDISVEDADTSYRDGLGIGFTAQDPDKWPLHRKPIPKNAFSLPRTATVGYSGQWFLQGRSELNKGSWEPGKLSRGDVVTAVLAGPPANIMRVLVNGKVVAQQPADKLGLPEVGKEPMWGVVDVESACKKIRIGNRIKITPNDLDHKLHMAGIASRAFQ